MKDCTHAVCIHCRATQPTRSDEIPPGSRPPPSLLTGPDRSFVSGTQSTPTRAGPLSTPGQSAVGRPPGPHRPESLRDPRATRQGPRPRGNGSTPLPGQITVVIHLGRSVREHPLHVSPPFLSGPAVLPAPSRQRGLGPPQEPRPGRAPPAHKKASLLSLPSYLPPSSPVYRPRIGGQPHPPGHDASVVGWALSPLLPKVSGAAGLRSGLPGALGACPPASVSHSVPHAAGHNPAPPLGLRQPAPGDPLQPGLRSSGACPSLTQPPNEVQAAAPVQGTTPPGTRPIPPPSVSPLPALSQQARALGRCRIASGERRRLSSSSWCANTEDSRYGES